MAIKKTRREFLRDAASGGAAIAAGIISTGALSYSRILGSNDRVRVGIVGFSDRAKATLIPALLVHAGELNFEITAISDIWNRRREEGGAFVKQLTGKAATLARNNEEMYERRLADAVIISTADFQHALHGVEAVHAGVDAYIEKPMAESMADARDILKAVKASKQVVQIGSQRRSGANYVAAHKYIASGKFGAITMVEMTWNVNQPGRWRRPKLVAEIQQSDTDWKRYVMGKTQDTWNARKYIEYRLFWPYSSGIPGQWMSHQIDTVHWFSGLRRPRSVVANGGIYVWKDGRENADTMTAVFDYGPLNDPITGFQVVYSSRMHNSAGGVKEIYFSNAGTLNLDNNEITPEGGLRAPQAAEMGMTPNLLEPMTLESDARVVTEANTSVDGMSSAHMRNWMECIRSRKTPNADIVAGYDHSVANVMTTAALHTGLRVTFDDVTQEVMAGGTIFR
jgi:predicted dehydrogenase